MWTKPKIRVVSSRGSCRAVKQLKRSTDNYYVGTYRDLMAIKFLFSVLITQCHEFTNGRVIFICLSRGLLLLFLKQLLKNKKQKKKKKNFFAVNIIIDILSIIATKYFV